MNSIGILVASASLAAVQAGASHAKALQYEIPAQPLSSALQQFALQGNTQILFSPDAVEGQHSPGISGAFEADAALRSLLSRSRLRFQRVDDAFVIAALQTGAGPAAVPSAMPPQEASFPAATSGIEDIVVTAQKREENLQDIPISIAVLGGADLERKGIANLTDFIGGAVPALRIMPNIGRTSSLNITMRGIGGGDPTQISRDPANGIYIDGVYLGRVQGLGMEMFDIERIEVLRGPQGTLFGRNAVGGAISIVSRRPTGELGLDLTAGVRNLDGFNVKGHLNLPEFAGIRVKLDGVWSKRDGWVRNSLAGQSDWGDYERHGVRATALWTPADTLEVRYSFEKSRDKSVSGYSQILRLLEGAPPLAPIFDVEPERVRQGRAGVPLKPGIGDVQGHSLQVTWELSDALTLKSISAYRELEQSQSDNAAGNTVAFRPFGVFGRVSIANVDQDQFSQEVQLIGSLDRLTYVLGAFYFDEDASDYAHTPYTNQFNADGTGYIVLPEPVGGPFPDRASTSHAKSTAFFGQATYTPPVLDDRLHLTGGLRWTHDRKHGRLTALRGAPTPFRYEFSSKRVDPSATVAFDWREGVNTYLRWATAYRAGGANSRSATYGAFGEEEVDTWEIGIKSDLLDRHLRLNAAAYHTRYKNRQVGFPNPGNPSNTETINVPDAEIIKGVEIDVTAVLSPDLTVTLGYALTDWNASTDRNPFTGQVQPSVLNYSPRHAATAALDYEFPPFSFGALSAHVNATYSSSFYTQGSDNPKTGEYLMLNGRLTLGALALGAGGPDVSVSLWAKNITNAQWETYQFALRGPGVTNAVLAHFNEPRTYGIEARVKF
ncbi:MAG TPA: TonB-dependent receptor [Pedomonas sp.]|uniref:TonB-dependent receptor n=1 Tax=Pedomonas sp. TaxID=2976421 RepID=UPI002F3E7D29